MFVRWPLHEWADCGWCGLNIRTWLRLSKNDQLFRLLCYVQTQGDAGHTQTSAIGLTFRASRFAFATSLCWNATQRSAMINVLQRKPFWVAPVVFAESIFPDMPDAAGSLCV